MFFRFLIIFIFLIVNTGLNAEKDVSLFNSILNDDLPQIEVLKNKKELYNERGGIFYSNSNVPNIEFNDITPLMLSVLISKDEKLVEFLIKNGANPNVKDSQGRDLLMLSIFNSKIFKIIVHNKKYDASNIDFNGNTALHYAAVYGDASMIKKLIDHGWNPNQLNNYNESPLIYATYYGKFDNLKMLIKCGADMRQQGPSGFSLLSIALTSPYILDFEIADFLLNNKYDLDMKDEFGRTIFEQLAEAKKGGELICSSLKDNLERSVVLFKFVGNDNRLKYDLVFAPSKIESHPTIIFDKTRYKEIIVPAPALLTYKIKNRKYYAVLENGDMLQLKKVSEIKEFLKGKI